MTDSASGEGVRSYTPYLEQFQDFSWALACGSPPNSLELFGGSFLGPLLSRQISGGYFWTPRAWQAPSWPSGAWA